MNIVKVGLAAIKFVKKASPILLSAGAGIGMVLTYVLAIRETEEAQEVIQEAEEQEGTAGTIKTAKKLIKIYGPSLILLILSLLCIVQSTVISQHRIRDLTASYAALVTFVNEYRNKQIELHGDASDQEIVRAIAREHYLKNPPPSEEDRILCFMPTYPNWFTVPSLEDLYHAFLMVNEHIDLWGFADLVQLFKEANAIEYDELGHDRGIDPRYIHYGWEEYDLCDEEGISGVYPKLSEYTDDSGLEGFIIDIPAPKPLEVLM